MRRPRWIAAALCCRRVFLQLHCAATELCTATLLCYSSAVPKVWGNSGAVRGVNTILHVAKTLMIALCDVCPLLHACRCMAHTMMLSGATCRYGWEGDQAAGQSVPPPQGAAAMPCCWLQFCIATMLCSSRMLPNPRTRCCHTVSPACCIAASVAPATGAAGQAAEAAGQATERGSGAGDGRSRAGDEARRRKRGDGGDGSGVTEAQRGDGGGRGRATEAGQQSRGDGSGVTEAGRGGRVTAVG